ncbi:MAG: BREX-3 system P-loop-containing protein BrxF [Bacillota bacterium]
MESTADRVIKSIGQATDLYYRLVIIVAPAGSGKTVVLKEMQKRVDASLINVNLELSRLMLDLTERQRALQLNRLLTELINSSKSDIVLLDNIELLFDINFKQDPLRLLQGLSRKKTVVAAWNGLSDEKYLFYATPDHPEYKKYPLKDFLIVNIEIAT